MVGMVGMVDMVDMEGWQLRPYGRAVDMPHPGLPELAS